MLSGRIVEIAFLACILAACTKCPDGQRPREEALALAMQFASDSFLSSAQRELPQSTLQIINERYQSFDRAWYFRITSSDRDCVIEVAVPDCDAMESAGGGSCGHAQEILDGDA